MFYSLYICLAKQKTYLMKKTASGNLTLSRRELILLYSLIRYILEQPNVPYKEYRCFGNILLTKQDLAFFKKLVRFFETEY